MYATMLDGAVEYVNWSGDPLMFQENILVTEQSLIQQPSQQVTCNTLAFTMLDGWLKKFKPINQLVMPNVRLTISFSLPFDPCLALTESDLEGGVSWVNHTDRHRTLLY